MLMSEKKGFFFFIGENFFSNLKACKVIKLFLKKKIEMYENPEKKSL